jgi:hypothetical protein
MRRRIAAVRWSLYAVRRDVAIVLGVRCAGIHVYVGVRLCGAVLSRPVAVGFHSAS